MAERSLPATVVRAVARTALRPFTARRTPEPTGEELIGCARMQLPVPPAEVSAELFRGVMAAFPTAVTVVTSRDAEGDPRGLTCSAVASVSADPPLVAIFVNRRNGSLEAIRRSGGFALNLLNRDSAAVSDIFASPSAEKFRSVRWRPSRVTGNPWLTGDTTAMLDCRLAAEVEVATHAVLIGLVVDAEIGEADDPPLLYWRRSYGSWSPAEAPAPFSAAPVRPLRTGAVSTTRG